MALVEFPTDVLVRAVALSLPTDALIRARDDSYYKITLANTAEGFVRTFGCRLSHGTAQQLRLRDLQVEWGMWELFPRVSRAVLREREQDSAILELSELLAMPIFYRKVGRRTAQCVAKGISDSALRARPMSKRRAVAPPRKDELVTNAVYLYERFVATRSRRPVRNQWGAQESAFP